MPCPPQDVCAIAASTSSSEGASTSSSEPPGPLTSTAGSEGIRRSTARSSSSSRISRTSSALEVALPLLDVEVEDAVGDLLEEALGDDSLVLRDVLVAEEELDELPLVVLEAGGGRAQAADASGAVLVHGVVAEEELISPARTGLLDQGVDHVELPLRAHAALEVALEHLDGDRGALAPEAVPRAGGCRRRASGPRWPR